MCQLGTTTCGVQSLQTMKFTRATALRAAQVVQHLHGHIENLLQNRRTKDNSSANCLVLIMSTNFRTLKMLGVFHKQHHFPLRFSDEMGGVRILVRDLTF